MDMDKPLLMVDVDGVISLFGFDPARPPAGRFELVDGIAHLLSATAGEHLRALWDEFELVWCTGWEERANDYLPVALGLPGTLPLVPFDAFDRPASARSKLVGIDAYAGPSTPLAWIDDAHDERSSTWADARCAPTLLVTTDAAVGLTAEHVDELLAWARAQSAPA
jgi:Swiss Army Knife RNA repair-like protein